MAGYPDLFKDAFKYEEIEDGEEFFDYDPKENRPWDLNDMGDPHHRFYQFPIPQS